jgi:TRAP-type mannitol/chloroaromatic compound transport system permease small subunit
MSDLSALLLVFLLIVGSLIVVAGVLFSIIFILEIILEPKVKFLRTITTDNNNYKFSVYSYGNIFTKKQLYALEKDLHTPIDFIYTEQGELASYSEKKAVQGKILEQLKTKNKIKEQIISAENNFTRLKKSHDNNS